MGHGNGVKDYFSEEELVGVHSPFYRSVKNLKVRKTKLEKADLYQNFKHNKNLVSVRIFLDAVYAIFQKFKINLCKIKLE